MCQSNLIVVVPSVKPVATRIRLVIILLFSLPSASVWCSQILTGPAKMETLSAFPMEHIMKYFCGCEGVLVEQHRNEFGVTKQNNREGIGIGANFPDEMTLIDFNLAKMIQDNAGVRTVSVGVNLTYPRHSDIHKYTFEHCSLGILYLHEFTRNIETWLVNTLIPRYAPILRKDMDHFVLISPNEKISDRILLSTHFGSKIKYKLALFQVPTGINCKTVDLYGNRGNSVLKVLRTFRFKELLETKEVLSLFPDSTKNFHGKVFRFSIPKVAFRFEIELRADGKYHPKRGFYKWWLDEAMLKFNFTYDIFWASYGGGTGKLLENNTWVGATGDLFYGKADCSFIVGEIYSRHKYLGWSSSISYEWIVFMTHTPRKSYSPKAIFKPFTPIFWSIFIFSLIVSTLVLKSLALAPFSPENLNNKWNYGQMLEYMMSTLLEQDRACPLSTSSIRVLCSFWLLYAVVITTAYRGKLVSLIAFPVNTWIPSTFEELANSNFKVALNTVGKAGAAYVLIATSSSPVFKTIANRMEIVPEAENCLERAMNEDLGCITWKGIADYAMVKNLTDKHGRVPLQESSQIALFIGDGLVYERRAIFGEHFDRTIQAAMQMGLTIKWFQLDQTFIKLERREWERNGNVAQKTYKYDDGPKKLVMSQFNGLFLLSLFGYCISWGQLLAEILLYKSKGIFSTSVDEFQNENRVRHSLA